MSERIDTNLPQDALDSGQGLEVATQIVQQTPAWLRLVGSAATSTAQPKPAAGRDRASSMLAPLHARR